MIVQLSSTEKKKKEYMCRDQMRGHVWLMDFLCLSKVSLHTF